ncbi:hypothetical protein ABB02_01728 [Clostridiaceae bacterium JG1575]|nr:hypothetical protein ABB02_01728 [Clostridiaceae bacterium JG1575]
MRPPRLVLFDLDGTLIDTEPTSLEAWISTGREFGIPMTHKMACGFIGRTTASVRDELLPYFEHEGMVEEFIEAKKKRCRSVFERELQAKPGAKTLLLHLQEWKVDVCVATSSARGRSQEFLRRLGLWEMIDFLVGAEDISRSKPDPEIFQTCLAHAKVPAEDALVVEDAYHGILAAHRAGIPCVMIPDLLAPTEPIEELGATVYSDLLVLDDALAKQFTALTLEELKQP